MSQLKTQLHPNLKPVDAQKKKNEPLLTISKASSVSRPTPLSDSLAAASKLKNIYSLLLDHYGPRGWWPGQSPFEVMVGAILTQNTAWRNVEKAIDNLRANKLLSAEAIDQAPQSVLEAIRPSGYYNVKGKRLFSLVKFILANGRGGQRPQILDWPMETLRPALLSVNGIGPETADCILLYAALQPSFVVDLYTRRLLSRHGLALGHEPYEEIRAWFMRSLPSDVKLYNEFHALIVAAGHHNCYPRSPKCPVCPLRDDPLLSLS